MFYVRCVFAYMYEILDILFWCFMTCHFILVFYDVSIASEMLGAKK